MRNAAFVATCVLVCALVSAGCAEKIGDVPVAAAYFYPAKENVEYVYSIENSKERVVRILAVKKPDGGAVAMRAEESMALVSGSFKSALEYSVDSGGAAVIGSGGYPVLKNPLQKGTEWDMPLADYADMLDKNGERIKPVGKVIGTMRCVFDKASTVDVAGVKYQSIEIGCAPKGGDLSSLGSAKTYVYAKGIGYVGWKFNLLGSAVWVERLKEVSGL
ncbi:MAG: hypothetical protein OEV59_00690 [Deltaproteobacteria bacterium]|nr:hypothetical protein [Deltaproteobacteria bacterium]